MHARGVALAAALAAVFLLILPDPAAGDVLLAVAVAVLALRLSRHARRAERPPAPSRRALRRLRDLPGFAARIAADVTRGTWQVALIVLRIRRLPRPGIVELPMGELSEREGALLGLLVTLSPGSVLIEVDPRRRVLVFHAVGRPAEEFTEAVASLGARALARTLPTADRFPPEGRS